MVVRSGYGILYLPNDIRCNLASNNDPVNSFNNRFSGTLDNSVTPTDVLRNPFPSGLLHATGRTPNVQQVFYGQSIAASIYNAPYSYAQQWNFDVERELPGGIALSVAYAGSKGTHLPGPDQNLDQLPTQFMSLG